MGPGNQTTLLSAMALKYDPYRQVWEKRLARYVSWQWRSTAGDARARRPFHVDALLDAAGKEIDPRRPAVTRERLEKALDTLEEDGVIASWHYERWDDTLARHRGWMEDWRSCTVLIAPPSVVTDHLQSPAREPALALPADALAQPERLGERIRARRVALGLNQSQAAAALGASQGYISKLERGKLTDETPSPAFRKRLGDWLAGR